MQLFNLLVLCSFAVAKTNNQEKSQASPLSQSPNWDKPASLQVTTNDQGQSITKTIWWIPPTTVSTPTSLSNSINSVQNNKKSTTETSQNGPATILTSSNSQGEYTSTIWWLPSTSLKQESTSNPSGEIVTLTEHGKKTTSTISNPSLSSSPSGVQSTKLKNDNITIPAHSNAGGKMMDMSYSIGTIVLAIMLI